MSYEIVLRELEPLLREELGNDLIVLEYNTEPLLPPGENYGSTILSVHAVVKYGENSQEEDLYLVAKMLPTSEYQRTIFDSPFTFKKEIFMYKNVMPFYKKFQIEFGVGEMDVLDVLPKFYGARLSLKQGINEVDDDAVLLMDNLKIKGYYMGERRDGLDLPHAEIAVSSLARFHALGMAVKYKKPEFFEILKVRSKCLDLKSESFDDVTESFLKVFRDDPQMSKHIDRITEAMTQESAKSWSIPPEEPWSTIITSDFWVNNILFKKNECGDVVDVKFVDFQNFLFMSPLRELTFFLTTSLNFNVMENHFEELLTLYHDTFIEVLKTMQCNIEPFVRSKFDERLKIDAFKEFPHGPFMMKMMTADVEKNFEGADMKSFIRTNFANPPLVKKLRMFVGKYVEKGWL